MTQAPYQQAPYQQGYQPQAQGQAPYQQAPNGYQPQGPQPGQYQPQAPYQQGPPQQNGGYQPAPQGQGQQGYQPAPQQQQGQYQPVGQQGPVQGNLQDRQQQQNTMQAYQPSEDGSDPMLEDFTVFRGVAPYLSFSDPQCTGYERGGTILAIGTDYAKKYKTSDPLFWEYGPKKGQQRMCRVLIIQTNERIPGRQDDTGIRTLELMDGKDIFKAAALAVRAANPNKPAFEVGGQIYITRTGTRPSQGGQDAVTYTARYVPAPADYVASDQGLMAQNMLDQAQGQSVQSPGGQQLQQAAAYVANTPNAPANGQPQYQPAPQGAPQPAPAAAQGQPAWMAQGPQQQAPAGQQAPAPWMAQGPQQAPQGQPNGGYQPTPSHPFGPSPQQPMPSPYPPQQQG